jgi:hypothetical protein
VERQERGQRALATTHPRQHRATDPRDLRRQSSTYQLTGTGAEDDNERKQAKSEAIALKLKLNLAANFYSILDNTAPPTCQVDKQDDDHVEQVNSINELKQGVLNGSIPSAIADSGATSSVGTKRDKKRNAFVATGRQLDKAFRMPNGEVEEASNMDELQHDVRHPTKDVHIVPGIERDSLLSIPKFADANYVAIFYKDEVNIYDANKTTIVILRGAILRGWRCNQTNLWRIPLINKVTNEKTDTVLCDRCPTEFLPDRPPPNEAIHNVYELKTQPELVRYYHAAAGFPTKSSWLKAIKNKQYASWPGLTWEAVNKNFPESQETLKGHGQKTRSGLRSTKATPQIDNEEECEEATNHTRPPTRQKEAIIRIYDLSDEAERLMYTDQTGRFPQKSSRGNQYIMVLIEIDSNAILVEAMKNRTTGEMIRAYQVLVDRLRSAGVTPKMHILDNKCSAEFKEQIKSNNMQYQLVPPHDHRRNIAEKAIQVFKAHFISILCGADKSFSLHLWDRLLGQAEHTNGPLPLETKSTHTYPQHAPNFEDDTNSVSVCIPLGQTRLQFKPFRTTGMQS